MQGLHTLAQVAAGAGLAADFDATAQFLGVPKPLVHIRPQLPFAVTVASNGTPSRLKGFFLQRAKVQGSLKHGLLLGYTHRQAVLAKKPSKTRQSLRGHGGWGVFHRATCGW
ncbi:MAG: hypothetical protein EB066_09325, partial [Betaproteobacteria bacterium]|nr:hypothetical protein [Betaproteobacteria bacterium]